MFFVSQLVMELLKRNSTGGIFKTVMREERFAKSECHKINRRHFLHKN